MQNIAIIGASGAIGAAFVEANATSHPDARIYAFSRAGTDFKSECVTSAHIDLLDETSIAAAARTVEGKLNMVIVAAGMLHDDDVGPEKSLKELSAKKFERLFAVNTVGPALTLKHFAPLLSNAQPSVFAVLSARVGSISDNRLGGWYAYRASKAALNMIMKTASIEVARKNKNAVLVGLHPGTVDSALSAPFQGNVPDGKLFTPQHSVACMLEVIQDLGPDDSGCVFDYSGKKIAF